MIESVQHKYRWYALARSDQDAYVRLLWDHGYSEGAIARFFNIGKGVIVRRRHTLRDLKPASERTVIKSFLTLDRFEDLLELARMREIEETSGVAIATSISTVDTCQWPLVTGSSLKKPKLCGQPCLPGHKVCEEHFLALKRSRRAR